MPLNDIILRARTCVGARFRLHGRDPAFGLDCVGLAGHALALDVPGSYALRGGDPDDISARVAATGLLAIPSETAGGGNLVLIAAGPRQYHLAILSEAGFVHAHAGLRRVVETPGRPCNVIGAWRKSEQ